MAKITAIVCEVMRDEWVAANRRNIETVFLEQGLHRVPEKLHKELQAAIDKANCDVVLLGYGLCSNALVGLSANNCTLVLPLVEDCIGLFLGSMSAYMEEFKREPGTYYFTKGWVEAEKDPYQEYFRSVEKWGEEAALWIARETMKNYSRAACIDTGCYDIAKYYAYAGQFADFFGMRTEIVPGAMDFFNEILAGVWRRCLEVKPGGKICEKEFRRLMQLAEEK